MPSERMDHSPKPDVDLNESSLSFLSSLSSGKDEDSMLLSDQLNINILNSLTSSNIVNAETLESTFDLNSEKDNSKTSSGMMTSMSNSEQSSILNEYLKVSESLSNSSSIPTSGNFVFQTPSVKNVDLSPFSTCKIASTATNKQGTQVLILQKPSTNLSSMMMQAKKFPVASGSNVTIAPSVMGATSNTPKILTLPTLSAGSNIINPVASATTMKGGDVKFFINQVPGSSNFTTVKQISSSNSSTVQIPLKRSVTQSSTGQVITKVIFTNNASSNQSLSTPVSITGSSTSVNTQPQSILLSSPSKTYTLSRSVGGSQQILRTLPGTPTKQGMFVLSPVKSVQKITNVPITFSKSPRRIAPATNAVISTLNAGSRVATVVCPTSSVAATSVPAVKNFSVQSPTKVILKSVTPQTVFKPVIGNTSGTRTSTNFSTVVSSVVQQTTQSPATQSIQVPGSKFHYVRLVSAPTTSTTNTVEKQTTLIQASNASGLAGNLVSNTTHSTASTLVTSSQIRPMVPIAPAKMVAPKQVGQRILIPAGSGSQIRSTNAGQLSQLSTGTLIPVGNNSQSYVMVPAQYVTQLQQSSQSGSQVIIQHPNILPAPTTAATTSSAGCFANHPSYISITTSNTHTTSSSAAQQQSSCSSNPAAIVPSQVKLANGRVPPPPEVDNRPRKPCNCTKSQCLKLYCDCFANGEFCNNCNCNNCYNNLLHEEERQKAIKACLDRNPLAFHPKIGKTREGDQERRHTKGCNCKRSGCLKNYCECYEAKILCTNLCKCIGCKNFEDSSERKTLMHLADAAEVRVQQQAAAKTNLSSQILDMPTKPPMMSRTGERLPFAFVTDEVLEATCMCLMAQGEESERSNTSEEEMEKLILQEFGRCLVQIIDSANKTKVSKMDVQ